MSSYKITYDNNDAYSFWIDQDNYPMARAESILNEQAEEIATLKAALDAQSETIAMYKQFAHIVLAYAEDGNLYHLQVIARGVLGDSAAVAATTQDESESGE